jgi:hypothetical protein
MMSLWVLPKKAAFPFLRTINVPFCTDAHHTIGVALTVFHDGLEQCALFLAMVLFTVLDNPTSHELPLRFLTQAFHP